MISNKKSISDVVAEVFLITLAITAVGIVSSLILPMIKDKANLSPTLSCIDLGTFPPIAIRDACFNKQTKDIELTLQRIAKDINLASFTFIVRENQNVISFKCDGSCNNCEVLPSGKVKTYFLNFPQFNQKPTITWSIDSCEMGTTEISKICS